MNVHADKSKKSTSRAIANNSSKTVRNSGFQIPPPRVNQITQRKQPSVDSQTNGVVQMLSASGVFQHGTKGLRDMSLTHPDRFAEIGLLGQIDEFIKDYNQIRGRKWITRQQTLDTIESLLNKFITSNNFYLSRALTLRPSLNAMLNLLDELGTDHQNVITAMTRSGQHQIYTKNNSAGAGPMVIDYMWRRILSGNSSIRVLNYDYSLFRLTGRMVRNDAFKNKILASIAKMLSTRTGQTLIGQLLNQNKIIRIIPLTDSTQRARRAISEGVRDANRRRGIHIPERLEGHEHGNDSPGLTSVDPTETTVGSYLHAVGRSRNAIDVTGSPVLHPDPHNTGNNAVVAISPTLSNSTALALDPNFSLLPTPVFLTLAHELVHAKHIATGTSRGGVTGFVDPVFTNAEEKHTIADSDTSENTLRAEHNLGVRHGHIGAIRAHINNLLRANVPRVLNADRVGLPAP